MKISQSWFDVILWWVKMFTGLGKLPTHWNRNLKVSPEFPRGSSSHLQPKFPRGFPLPTTTIPGDSPQNLRDFARWGLFGWTALKIIIFSFGWDQFTGKLQKLPEISWFAWRFWLVLCCFVLKLFIIIKKCLVNLNLHGLLIKKKIEQHLH